jgi:hypothetical protein
MAWVSLAGGADEFHFGKGTARLIEPAPGVFTVRLEDFAVRNGPDLFVYLSPSADGYTDGVVELGHSVVIGVFPGPRNSPRAVLRGVAGRLPGFS